MHRPPPLSIEECIKHRIQADFIDTKSVPHRKTFDDLETAPKQPIKILQGDSLSKSVNKVAHTHVGYIPLSGNAPQRAIAPLPNDNLQVLHPGAVLIECPHELKMGMNASKLAGVAIDPNQILECKSYR